MKRVIQIEAWVLRPARGWSQPLHLPASLTKRDILTASMKMTLTTSVKETCLLTLGKTSTWWNKGRESPRYCRVLWVGLKGGKEMKTVSPFSGTFLWVLKTKQEQNAHEKYLRLDSNKENLARLWKFSWKLSVNSLYSICLHSFHVWTNSPLFGVFFYFSFCFVS